MINKIYKCRICGNANLVEVLDLGLFPLSGYFLKSRNEVVKECPLILVKCHSTDKNESCGLLQLAHSVSVEYLYGEHYGYCSELNSSMVHHLRSKVKEIEKLVVLQPNDIVVDIGSNDGTTLKSYNKKQLNLIGIDPIGDKFSEKYIGNITLVNDFFSPSLCKQIFKNRKAKVVTSFAMFYDLEDPIEFASAVHSILDDDGVWVLEQSYMPFMLINNSFDTICHEHLEYYGLRQIKWIAEKANLKIVSVSFNDINGGSFSVVLAKNNSSRTVHVDTIENVLSYEDSMGLRTLKPYFSFGTSIKRVKKEFQDQIKELKNKNKKIAALGASTKGNIILQFFELDANIIECIGEVNSDKFGKFTPGTKIPIIEEHKVLSENYDYFIILPWHFKHFFDSHPSFSSYQNKFIYPLLIKMFEDKRYLSMKHELSFEAMS